VPPLDNARHERFAQNLVQGESASEAYINAGFKGDRGNASRLAASPGVRARIAELQGQAATGAKITVQSLIAEFEEARQKATSLPQLSAVVRAIESKAKISALLVQKLEIGGAGDFNPKRETPEGIVTEWLEGEAKVLPELTPYYNFTDDDHAFLVARLTEVFDLIHRRQWEAREARNQSLMPAYKRTITATVHRAKLGTGKTSPK
jgi:hypothetical protein